MKQHITIEQWGEISEEEQEIFWNRFAECTIVLPNIGEMIEFLGDEWVQLYNNTFTRMTVEDYISIEEMCDHLWEAVKSKLKQ